MVASSTALGRQDIRWASGLAGFGFRLACTVAGPALLSLAFPPFDVGPIALIALVPLFLLWSKLTWKQAFWWGWLAGILMFLTILYWTSITIFEFVGAWSSLALTLLCAIEGFAVAATAVSAALVGKGAFRLGSIFGVPAAWVIFESIRTNGSLGVPFGQLGLVASHMLWLLPIAALGGVYLLTAVVALANAAVAAILVGSRSLRIAGAVVLGFLAVIVAISDTRRVDALAPATLRVAIAQGNIEQDVKWTPQVFVQSQKIYANMTREAASRGARVVVWPETAITTSAPQDRMLLQKLTGLAASTHVWMLAGTIDTPTPQGYYNALIDLTPQGSVSGIYHKHWLVPFAEYLPFANLLRRLPIMDQASTFLAGPGPHVLSAGGYSWGPLICYESAFAPYARATVNAGADVIVIATDDAWFNSTPEPYQHADIAAVQAVATGRWIVRAASTGISEIINPHGVIVSALGVGQRGIVMGNIGQGIQTPYDRYGAAWLITLCLVVLASGIIVARVRHTA